MFNRVKRSILRRATNLINKFKTNESDYIYFKKNQKLINIGAGNFSHPKWINLEYSTEWYDKLPGNFISYNLTSNEIWPLENNSVDAYYCSHVIEHILKEDVERMVVNAFKSLKKGGVLRITCPDASILYDACKNKDYSYFADQINFYSLKENYKHQYKNSLLNAEIEDLLVDVIATSRCNLRLNSVEPVDTLTIKEKLESISKNEFLDWLTEKLLFDPKRAGEHITWWDYDKLKAVCKDAGFVDIKKSAYLQSSIGAMRIPNLFDSRHPHKSFYIECTK